MTNRVEIQFERVIKVIKSRLDFVAWTSWGFRSFVAINFIRDIVPMPLKPFRSPLARHNIRRYLSAKEEKAREMRIY